MSASQPITFDKVIRFIAGLAVVAAIVWLVNILSNVLLPFFLACLISYILEPIVEFCMIRLHIRWRIVAIFTTLISVAGIIAGLAYLFVPSIIREIHQLGVMVNDYSRHGQLLPFLPKEIHDYIVEYFDEDMMEKLMENQKFETLLSTGSSVVSASLEFLIHTLEWFLTFIYVIFILLDYEHIMRGFRLIVPPKYRPIAFKIGNDIKNSMNRYFRGQAVLALCAAVFYCIGFALVGIPLSIVLGILVGVLYMIPYFQYITLIPVAFVCLVFSMGGDATFWTLFGKCLLVYAISQTICDYILTPKIMGKVMGLNPAIILLSLSVWGTLLGLIGMIIALPLTTLLIAYYEEYVIFPHNQSKLPTAVSANAGKDKGKK
ncbi:MAG: AI-2E family transporter [Duncaniella sp.]|uniref:AI-2E family transporter n=1 Tax=Duncaniella sp. TaxID=2518496 RepID=UPI0023CC3AAC|nr:AI-2E family transporter [Duncaniella sp.]MDE6089210.1 AI-2E family transporter [Duncaniella sp.]